MAPGKGLACHMGGVIKSSNDFDARKQILVVITVTYEDSVNNKYADEFRFDFSDRILPST